MEIVKLIEFYGKKFSPSLLETFGNIESCKIIESGEISKSGRWKVLPSPYGLSNVDLSEKNYTIKNSYSFIKDIKIPLEKSNVDLITFKIGPNDKDICNITEIIKIKLKEL